MKKQLPEILLIQLYLLVITIEGLPALYFLLRLPSKEVNALFLGYSLPRLLLAGAVLCVWLVLLVSTLRAFLDRRWLRDGLSWIDGWLLKSDHPLLLLVTLSYFSLAGLFALLFFSSPFAINLDTLRAVYQRAFGLFLWSWAVVVETLLVVFICYARKIQAPGFLNRNRVIAAVTVMVILSLIVFHWLILIFREAIFTAIKGWYWQFHPKDFNPRDIIFLFMAALVFLCAAFILKRHRSTVLNLALLIVLGYILQVGFGFIEGRGFESLRLKYAESSYKHYALHASDRPPLLYAVSHYEEKYGRSFSLKTKPPGALLTYLLAQRVANLIDPEASFDGRFRSLTTLAAYAFPFLAMLVMLPLYYLSKRLLAEEDAFLPSLFYLVCPNVLLITLILDQFLYPLLFLCGVLLSIVMVKNKSFALALVTGGYIYISIFFSFSLLPLTVFAFLLVFLDFCLPKPERNLRRALLLVLGLILGLALLYAFFRLFLNYDFFLRYFNALAMHREHKRFAVDLVGILKALLINNVEFTLWVGVPLILLAVVNAVRSVAALIKKRVADSNWVMLAFVLTYVATNLFGQTRSEVGRLWLFMVPLVVLFAAPQAKALFKKKDLGVYFVLGLELMTVFLTYKFQDFY